MPRPSIFCPKDCLTTEVQTEMVCPPCWHSRDIAYDKPIQIRITDNWRLGTTKATQILGENGERYFIDSGNGTIMSMVKYSQHIKK